MGRNYLLVIHDYPPINSARAIRWSSIAEFWAQDGHRIDVISGWQSSMQHEQLLHDVHVHRVNALWLERIRGWFKTHKPQDTSEFNANSKRRTKPGRRWVNTLVSWMYHRVYKQLYWPDSAFHWFPAGTNQARKLLSKTDYDAVITVSPYFTAHLIGMRLLRKFPHLKWLVDIGDPFSYLELEHPNNRRLFNALNHWVEHRVFRRAHVISVTTKLTLDRYRVLFPDCASKLSVIPPLLVQPSMEGNPAIKFSQDGKIRLVYLGRLYRDVRSPDFLLKLFAALLDTPVGDRLELHFIGDTRDVRNSFEPYRSRIGETIFIHGMVDHSTAESLMHSADVLVNIGNRTSYQLPSKVVEYASTSKPILNLSQIENDSSAAFFDSLSAVLNLMDSPELDFNLQVEELYKFIIESPSKINQEERAQWVSQFHVASIASKYEGILFKSSTKSS